MGAIAVERVSKSFGAGPILDAIDLAVGEAEFVAVLGRSGSGKSTLLRLIAGLDAPAAGRIERRGRLAMAFQEARLMPWLRVADNLGFVAGGGSQKAAIPCALAEVGLADKADAWPHTLSGGQAQRVSLARALLGRPEILLLDEPFGALDALTRREMQDLVHQLRLQHGFSAVMVTHDPEEAVRLADRIIVLAKGRATVDIRPPGAPLRSAADHFDVVQQLLEALGIH